MREQSGTTNHSIYTSKVKFSFSSLLQPSFQFKTRPKETTMIYQEYKIIHNYVSEESKILHN